MPFRTKSKAAEPHLGHSATTESALRTALRPNIHALSLLIQSSRTYKATVTVKKREGRSQSSVEADKELHPPFTNRDYEPSNLHLQHLDRSTTLTLEFDTVGYPPSTYIDVYCVIAANDRPPSVC